MAIEFSCASCGRQFRVEDQMAGKNGRCPQCETVIQIPAAPVAVVASAPVSPSPSTPVVAQFAPSAVSSSSMFDPEEIRKQREKLRIESFLLIVIAMIIHAIGFLFLLIGIQELRLPVNKLRLICLIIFILSLFLFVCGVRQGARAKGQSGYWGALGFLSIIGLFILALLPDMNKNSSKRMREDM